MPTVPLPHGLLLPGNTLTVQSARSHQESSSLPSTCPDPWEFTVTCHLTAAFFLILPFPTGDTSPVATLFLVAPAHYSPFSIRSIPILQGSLQCPFSVTCPLLCHLSPSLAVPGAHAFPCLAALMALRLTASLLDQVLETQYESREGIVGRGKDSG